MVKHLRTEVGGELWKHIQENCNVNFEGTPYKKSIHYPRTRKVFWGKIKRYHYPKTQKRRVKQRNGCYREIGNLKLTFEEGEPRNYAKMMDKLVGKVY